MGDPSLQAKCATGANPAAHWALPSVLEAVRGVRGAMDDEALTLRRNGGSAALPLHQQQS